MQKKERITCDYSRMSLKLRPKSLLPKFKKACKLNDSDMSKEVNKMIKQYLSNVHKNVQ